VVIVTSIRKIYNTTMPKRVWQPKKKKRMRKHGFLTRMKTSGGRKVLKRRMVKGRKKLTIAKTK